MLENVIITDGKLSQGLLEYQLFNFDESPADFTYRGEAAIEGDLLTIFQTSCLWLDYKIAKYATPESTEFCNGYEHGQAQKRKRWPSEKKSQKFVNGWLAAWRVKELGW